VRKASTPAQAGALAAWIAKNQQLVYIGGGAAVALVILIVIGLAMGRGGARNVR